MSSTIHVLSVQNSWDLPASCPLLPSLLCTKLGFGLFAPALPRSSFWGGRGYVTTAAWTCWMQDCRPHHFTRCRFLHRNAPASAWQQSAFFIHIFSEQEFCVYWQWGRSFWEVLCFCRAPSLWRIRGWPGQNSYRTVLLEPPVGRPLLIKLRPVWAQAASRNASKHFLETRWTHSFAALPCCWLQLVRGGLTSGSALSFQYY